MDKKLIKFKLTREILYRINQVYICTDKSITREIRVA